MPVLTDAQRVYYMGNQLEAAYLGDQQIARMRRNLMLRPVPTGTGGWSTGSSKISAVTYAAGAGREGRGAAVATRAAGTTSPEVIASIYLWGASGGALSLHPVVEEGKVYTLSVYAKTTREQWKGSVSFGWIDSGNMQIGTYVNGPQMDATPDEDGWFRLHHTATAPTGAVALRTLLTIWPSSGNAVAGELSWGCDAQLEEGTEATPFFYGETPGAQWLGEANASPSAMWRR